MIDQDLGVVPPALAGDRRLRCTPPREWPGRPARGAERLRGFGYARPRTQDARPVPGRLEAARGPHARTPADPDGLQRCRRPGRARLDRGRVQPVDGEELARGPRPGDGNRPCGTASSSETRRGSPAGSGSTSAPRRSWTIRARIIAAGATSWFRCVHRGSDWRGGRRPRRRHQPPDLDVDRSPAGGVADKGPRASARGRCR